MSILSSPLVSTTYQQETATEQDITQEKEFQKLRDQLISLQNEIEQEKNAHSQTQQKLFEEKRKTLLEHEIFGNLQQQIQTLTSATSNSSPALMIAHTFDSNEYHQKEVLELQSRTEKANQDANELKSQLEKCKQDLENSRNQLEQNLRQQEVLKKDIEKITKQCDIYQAEKENSKKELENNQSSRFQGPAAIRNRKKRVRNNQTNQQYFKLYSLC